MNQYCRQHKSVCQLGRKRGVISIGQTTLGSDLLFVSQAIDHPCEQHDATSLNQMLRKQQRKEVHDDSFYKKDGEQPKYIFVWTCNHGRLGTRIDDRIEQKELPDESQQLANTF